MEMRAAEGGERGEMGIVAHRGRARDKLKNAASKVEFFCCFGPRGSRPDRENAHRNQSQTHLWERIIRQPGLPGSETSTGFVFGTSTCE